MSNGNGWHRLTRNDLRGFNEDAIRIILAAMEAGGTARVSRSNHCIIRGPQGGTMSVGMQITKANRGLQNGHAEFKRVFGKDVAAVEEETAKTQLEERLAQTAEDLATTPSFNEPRPTLECPVKTCDAVFVTEGARYDHCQKQHYPCREPGCPHVSPNPGAETAHYRIVHLGQHPRRGTGKKQKEAAAKAAAPKPPEETVRVVTKVVKEGEVLKQIRHLIGPDPRVAELEAEVERLTTELNEARERAGELDAKLRLLKEALEL